MKDKVKNAAIRVKNHVKENKFGYAMTVVAIGYCAVAHANMKAFDKFLTEKGIDPMEFHLLPEDYEWMKNN